MTWESMEDPGALPGCPFYTVQVDGREVWSGDDYEEAELAFEREHQAHNYVVLLYDGQAETIWIGAEGGIQ